MDLQKAVLNCRINAFDIIEVGKSYAVKTYKRINETKAEFNARHERNLLKAEQLKTKKPV